MKQFEFSCRFSSSHLKDIAISLASLIAAQSHPLVGVVDKFGPELEHSVTVNDNSADTISASAWAYAILQRLDEVISYSLGKGRVDKSLLKARHRLTDSLALKSKDA